MKNINNKFTSLNGIIAVTDRSVLSNPNNINLYLEQIKKICTYKPIAIILREKDLSEDKYTELAYKISEICSSCNVPLILHTFVNTAIHMGIRRIHLPLHILRDFSDKNVLLDCFEEIGISIHSKEEAIEAVKYGATYLTAGHIFASSCKKNIPPKGLDFLEDICNTVEIPVYAIGGIDGSFEQLSLIKARGAAGGCMRSGAMLL